MKKSIFIESISFKEDILDFAFLKYLLIIISFAISLDFSVFQSLKPPELIVNNSDIFES
jgi:hypothetical protein